MFKLWTSSVYCAVQANTVTQEKYLSGLKVWQAKHFSHDRRGASGLNEKWVPSSLFPSVKQVLLALSLRGVRNGGAVAKHIPLSGSGWGTPRYKRQKDDGRGGETARHHCRYLDVGCAAGRRAARFHSCEPLSFHSERGLEVWIGRICWRRSFIAFHRCSASSQPLNKHSPWFSSHSFFGVFCCSLHLLPSCGEVLLGDWVGDVRGQGDGSIVEGWEHREPRIRSRVALYLLIHNGQGSAIMDEAGE